MCQTDKGSEFYNARFQALMKKWKIHHDSTEKNADIKASVIESLNRTIKQKMFRYFTVHSPIFGRITRPDAFV